VTDAAFFDLDRTLMAGSSGFHWVRAARAAGMVSRRQLAADALTNIRFRLRGSTDQIAQQAMARLDEALRGHHPREFQRLGPQVLAGVLPRLYPQMLDLAWDHQDAGRRVYIATAATQETAEMIAHVLGFDGAVGTRLEVDEDGVYTGKLAGPMAYREGKAAAIAQVARRDDVDLASSYAYSDSESDLPMLRAVGHPVVVNPDRELLRVAREEGWEVMRFETLGRRLQIGAAVVVAATLAAGVRVATRLHSGDGN
jgi:HAD superfamily hydrolase (TIGR01490 family)